MRINLGAAGQTYPAINHEIARVGWGELDVAKPSINDAVGRAACRRQAEPRRPRRA